MGSNSSKRASSVSKESQRPTDAAAKLTRSPFAGTHPAFNLAILGDLKASVYWAPPGILSIFARG